jgi:2-hydroxychromene-2-carboxylate isomerase
MADIGTSQRDLFAFDLASVETYFVAGWVWGRVPADIAWCPVPLATLGFDSGYGGLDGDRSAAELRARDLQLPLAWPESHPDPVPRAMRTAALAAEVGHGATFMLAATRLAFAGGYSLERDVELLAGVAGVAGLEPHEARLAAEDRERDWALKTQAERLLEQGIDRLPALRLSGTLAVGEQAINALVRSPSEQG